MSIKELYERAWTKQQEYWDTNTGLRILAEGRPLFEQVQIYLNDKGYMRIQSDGATRELWMQGKHRIKLFGSEGGLLMWEYSSSDRPKRSQGTFFDTLADFRYQFQVILDKLEAGIDPIEIEADPI
jgi:hypothetical protein